jgi:Gas vesicle protein
MSGPYVYEMSPVPADAGRALLAAEASAERVALVDLLDRVLAGGVVIAGDITLAIADVDLITVSLRALVASVSALTAPNRPAAPRAARVNLGKEAPNCPGPYNAAASTPIQTRSSRDW